MGLSIWELLVVLAIVFILFGAGKLPSVMRELGRGVRSFREAMVGESEQNDKRSKKVKKLK